MFNMLKIASIVSNHNFRERRYEMTFKKVFIRFSGVVIVLLSIAGCQKGASQAKVAKTDPLEVAKSADLQRDTEKELVENMARYRQGYKQHLKLMKDFYSQQGNHLKAVWVADELDSLMEVPQRSYLVIAEIASPNLRASQAIVDADVLYRDGMKLFKKARGKLGIFVNKKKMLMAKDKFNQLITSYPTSDKIDDAAFQIAEIYNIFLKDHQTAMLYYQRTWQWDNQTPWPARFAVAKIYDEKLHDLVKAVEYYEMAIKLEIAYQKKIVYARSRIKEINAQKGEQ